MNINRNVYTESKSPMRSVGKSKERSNTNDYSYGNNSIDTGEDNNNEQFGQPILNSGILENIMLNNSNNLNTQGNNGQNI